jgi:Zn-dependent protease/CBS domain-containing protein
VVVASAMQGLATMKTMQPARRRLSMRIARVAGIDVYVHVTFFLLLAWVAVSHLMKDGSVGGAASAVALLLCVFGSVVLHELGHALTARRFGIRTRDITLLPIGGVARLEKMPERPGQELVVALAGPAVNVALAGLLAVVLVLLGLPLVPRAPELTFDPLPTRLLWVNLSLAAFNLLPAFPMDGGRVLRAVLAMTMPRARATEVAAALGRALAVVFAVLGLLFSPMLVLLALFVWGGAGVEVAGERLKAVLSGASVEDTMVTEFHTLAPSEPVRRAVDLTLASFQTDYPVVEGERVVGVLTPLDLEHALAARGPDSSVGAAMRREFQRARPSEPADEALLRLTDADCQTLVVVEGERLVGLLTPGNAAEYVGFHRALARPPGASAG